MNKQEYDSELKILNKEYLVKKNKLTTEYALSNNPYKIGDTIKDHLSKIVIEKIQPISYFNDISCRYLGTKLKKDGTPFKSGEKIWIFQPNIEQGEK